MPVEIEAKMRLADRVALEARLAKLAADGAARFVADLLEVNTFFDTPGRDLRAADRGLRVRVEQDERTGRRQVVITHKGPRLHGPLKSRSETELVVADARTAAALLESLGFAATLSFEKRRTRYELDGCHVELDRLPHLGDFVEIEGPDDEAVLAVRRKLGLADEPLVAASYIALLSDYLGSRGLSGSHVAFEAP